MSLAAAIACVLLVWTGLFFLLAGLGRGLLRLACGRPRGEAEDLPDLAACAWGGYAALIAFLQVWHLFLPVDGRALATAVVLGGVSWWAWWVGRPAGPPRSAPAPIPRALLVVVALLVLWLADRAVGPCDYYDSGNYHLQMVRWFNEQAAVPGLANLYPLFGYGLSGLLFPALLEQGPGWERSHHFVNGFLVCLLVLLLARRVAALIGARAPRRHQVAAGLLVFPAVAAIGARVSTHATDLAPALVILAGCCLALEHQDRRRDLGGSDARLFLALALFAVAPCLKITAGAFAAVAWLTVAAGALRPPAPRRTLMAAAAFAAVALGVWMARGVLLTGYPLFPATIAAFDVDWRLPVEYAEGLAWGVAAYARMPDAWAEMVGQAGFAWLPYWLRVEFRAALLEALVPLALTAALLVLALLARAPRVRPAALLLLPLAVALPAWFLSAPAIRFGLPLFWILCLAVGAEVLPPVLAAGRHPRWVVPAALAVLALAPVPLQGYYVAKYQGQAGEAAALRGFFLTAPGPDHGFHPLIAPAVASVAVCDDLSVRIPALAPPLPDPGRWPEMLPWHAPLPATAHLLDGLCLRRPGDLEGGFRLRPADLPWPERHARAVAALAGATGWKVGRLATHFLVRPELIAESLRQPTAAPETEGAQ